LGEGFLGVGAEDKAPAGELRLGDGGHGLRGEEIKTEKLQTEKSEKME
jgi:hypothetical protein